MTMLTIFLGAIIFVYACYRVLQCVDLREAQTPFVARVLCEFFRWDEVVILASDFSWQGNGECLCEILCQCNRGGSPPAIRCIAIPDGKDDHRQFRVHMDCVQQPGTGEQAVVLGIIHGWRFAAFAATPRHR